jgi:hypothetical protein
MKKAAIKVPGVIFQDMLKLPFGVAIDEIIYDKEAQEFMVIIFGERMDDEAEVKGNKIRVADYEMSPVWHKGKITITEDTIDWPAVKKEPPPPKQKTNKTPAKDKEEVGEVDDEKETGTKTVRKSTRKRK